MSRILARAAQLMNILGAVLVAVILCAVCVQIVMRYVFDNATTWSDPVAASAMAWLTFIATTAAVNTDENMSVRFTWGWIGPRGRRIAEIVCQILTLIFAIFLSISAWELMQITSTAQVEGLPFTMTWAQMYSVTIFAGVFISVFAIDRAIAAWRGGER
jgi:TRAP-type transport system small permease protein